MTPDNITVLKRLHTSVSKHMEELQTIHDEMEAADDEEQGGDQLSDVQSTIDGLEAVRDTLAELAGLGEPNGDE